MGNFFITGASTGIGEATARHFDRLGHRVFAGVRTEAAGEALTGGGSGRLVPVICDVVDDASIEAARKRIDDEVGTAGLQGLINNAGVAVAGPLEHLPMDEWRRQFDVNVFGQIAVTKAFLPLVRRGRGRISFTGSIAGRHANGLLGPYAGSKHAIEAISQALRQELSPWDIEVSVVEPGAIKTPIWDKGRDTYAAIDDVLDAEAIEQYRDQIDLLGRGIEFQDDKAAPPEKVAEAFEHAMLASRPRTQYLVGIDAKVIGSATRVLPKRAVEALVDRLGPS